MVCAIGLSQCQCQPRAHNSALSGYGKPGTEKEVAMIATNTAPTVQWSRTVKRLAIHPSPHLEEILALWLLRTFGQEVFPGVQNAMLVFWPFGEGTPDGRPIAAHEAEGTLALGTALSRLDDHKVRHATPGVITCSAQLVAEALGVANDPALQDMLEYVSKIDSRGGASMFDLANIVKLLQDRDLGVMPDDPKQVIYWAWRGIKALYWNQQRFLQSARQEWARKASVWEASYRSKTLRIGEIYSGDRRIQQVGRFFGHCDVVVQHGPREGESGNSQIYINQRIRVPQRVVDDIRHRIGADSDSTIAEIEAILAKREPKGVRAMVNAKHWPEEVRMIADAVCRANTRPDVYWLTLEVARIIRISELKRLGEKNVDPRDPRLVQRQSIKELPHWYVLPEAGWVFNGCTSAPGVPVSHIPTKPRQGIFPPPWIELVYYALVPNWARSEVGLIPGPAIPPPQVVEKKAEPVKTEAPAKAPVEPEPVSAADPAPAAPPSDVPSADSTDPAGA